MATVDYGERKRRRLKAKIDGAEQASQLLMLHNQPGELEIQLRQQVFDEFLACEPDVIRSAVEELLTTIQAYRAYMMRGDERGAALLRDRELTHLASAIEKATDELRRMQDPRFDDPAS